MEELSQKVEDLEIANSRLAKSKKDLEKEVDDLKDELEGAESADVAEAMKRKMVRINRIGCCVLLIIFCIAGSRSQCCQ